MSQFVRSAGASVGSATSEEGVSSGTPPLAAWALRAHPPRGGATLGSPAVWSHSAQSVDLVGPRSMAYVETRLSLMRSFAACVLVMVLALTTPVGTGRGVHQADLLHPIFPHLHLLHGQVASDDDDDRLVTGSVQPTVQPPAGPALGAASGADVGSVGAAISPTVPRVAPVRVPAHRGRLDVRRIVPPGGFRDQPADPPPQAPA